MEPSRTLTKLRLSGPGQSSVESPHDGPSLVRRARDLRIKLPFAFGTTHVCDQAFGGTVSHHKGLDNEFAWDFTMPKGTPVLAAAHGRVVRVVQHFREGGFDNRYKEKANEIWIDHGGGILSSYSHLAPESARVRSGQLIAAGQVIAASGSTGFSVGPHLHFALIESGRQSLPAAFVEAGVPGKDEACTSANDGRGCSWFAGDSRVPATFFEDDGIELEAGPPAHAWRGQSTYRVVGRAEGHGQVAFFISDDDGGPLLANQIVAVDDEGRFELETRSLDELALGGRNSFCFALAPVRAQGRFSSSNMLNVALMETPDDEVTGVLLPFASGTAHPVWREPLEVDGQAVTGMAVELGEQASVLACAGGRVLEVALAKTLGVPNVPAKTLVVRVDHGRGLELLYAGLDAESVNWTPGQVVQGGAELGTVGLDTSNPRGRLLLVSLGKAPLAFAEAEGPLDGAAALSSRNGPENALVLTADSLLAPDAFAQNGVTLGALPERRDFPEASTTATTSKEGLPDLSASIHPLGAALRFNGSSAIPGGIIEVLVRSIDGRKKVTLGKARADDGGAFDLVVPLTEKSLARIGDRPMRYCVRARDPKARRKPQVRAWRPLVVVR